MQCSFPEKQVTVLGELWDSAAQVCVPGSTRRAASPRCTPVHANRLMAVSAPRAPQSHSKNVAFPSHQVAFNKRSQVFRADLHFSTHLQPLHCKLPLCYSREQPLHPSGMETALLTLGMQPENTNPQCSAAQSHSVKHLCQLSGDRWGGIPDCRKGSGHLHSVSAWAHPNITQHTSLGAPRQRG